VVSEDRTEQDEQGQGDDRESSPRPATAAARRERRTAGNRPAGRADTESRGPDAKGKPTSSVRRDERAGMPARLTRFIREVVAELRKVIWPTRKELLTYTGVVIAFVTIMVAIVALLDYGFAKAVLFSFGSKS